MSHFASKSNAKDLKSFAAAVFAATSAIAAIVILCSSSAMAAASSAGTTAGRAPSAQKNSDLDNDSAQALQQTQQLLKDQSAREKSLKDPEAMKADSEVKNLMGPDTQAMYDLTADILPTIVKEGHGDPAQIQVIMNQLLKNPESLASKLTPAQLAKLKAMAKSVEARQPSAAPSH